MTAALLQHLKNEMSGRCDRFTFQDNYKLVKQEMFEWKTNKQNI